MIAYINVARTTDAGNPFVTIRWSDPEYGFGEIYFMETQDSILNIETEFMGKDFVMKVLAALVDNAKITD